MCFWKWIGLWFETHTWPWSQWMTEKKRSENNSHAPQTSVSRKAMVLEQSQVQVHIQMRILKAEVEPGCMGMAIERSPSVLRDGQVLFRCSWFNQGEAGGTCWHLLATALRSQGSASHVGIHWSGGTTGVYELGPKRWWGVSGQGKPEDSPVEICIDSETQIGHPTLLLGRETNRIN